MASLHSYGPHASQVCELHAAAATRSASRCYPRRLLARRYGLDLEHGSRADLVARGWTVWNIEYRRLGDGGGWPATFDDVRAAIEALPVAAERRVVAIGHSAGGHLAVRRQPTSGLPAVVSQAGALDL